MTDTMSIESPDGRAVVYQDLHSNQLSAEEQKNRHSAQVILSLLKRYLEPKSVLDVGCGLGTWLDVSQEVFATSEVAGIEGEWTKSLTLAMPKHHVHFLDMEQGFDLNRRFDLAICLEVGEHLSPPAAPKLVESLVKHSGNILFSAAIPGQGGHDHRNEQFLSYWAKLFEQHGYVAVDLFRRHIWNDGSIHWWLQQNCVLFTDVVTPLMQHDNRGPIDVVHPAVYLSRLMQQQKHIQMLMDQVNGTTTMGA